MSRNLITILAAFLLVVSTAEASTISANQAELVIQNGQVELAEFPLIPVGLNLSLPVKEYLLPIPPGSSPDDLSFVSPAPVNLNQTVPLSALTDGVTSESNRYQSMVDESNQHGRLGRQPIEIVGLTYRDGIATAEIMYFPVTVDSVGELWFHPSVVLEVNHEVVNSPMLLDRDQIEMSDARSYESPSLSSGPEYLVITNSALAEPMQRLVDYKNETGYVTELHLIENILATQTGIDDAEKLRHYLIEAYEAGLQYVLLAGDETILPIRYAYHNSATSPPTLEMQQLCDLYFADLTGDWDTDGDNVWGEPYSDQPDITPELYLGRLPINTPTEASNYIDKLIRYETDPGDGDRSYLERTFFFSSDQMRDYGVGGQHRAIASAFPSPFTIDTLTAVEISSGDDLAPSNSLPEQVSGYISDGFGIFNVIAHGRSDGFVYTSSGYNNWPKTYMLTADGGGSHGQFSDFANPEKPAFYYSLACDNGGFDMDQPPFNHTTPNMAQTLIGEAGGAVGMVAYSRWGWISSSYLLQQAFFDSLFAHPTEPAVKALYRSKATMYYYRDLIYGLNYYGDPTLRIYNHEPRSTEIKIGLSPAGLKITLTADGSAAPFSEVILSENGVLLARYLTDSEGNCLIDYPLREVGLYKLTGRAAGAVLAQTEFTPRLITDVDEPGSPDNLPANFALHQNYPNPFNPSTNLRFDLPERSTVTLAVHNILGQVIKVLIEADLPAGSHELVWNGCDTNGDPVASGVYFYRLQAEGYSDVRKMILLK